MVVKISLILKASKYYKPSNYTTIKLYNYKTIQLYNYTTIQLYNFTTIQLYNHTPIQHYSFPIFSAFHYTYLYPY